MNTKVYYAHINSLESSIIQFHLNVPAGDKIPRIGTKVFATTDNGYHGKYAKITEIGDSIRFHASNNFGLPMRPFISVNYKAVIIE